MLGQRSDPDVRLLPAALCGWVAVAATLSSAATTRLVLAALLGLALVLVLTWARVTVRAPCRRSAVQARSARRTRAAGMTGRGARWVTTLSLALAASSSCLVASSLQQQLRQAGTLAQLAAERASVQLTGRVAGDPVLLQSPHASARTLVMVRLAVGRVEGGGQASTVSSRVLAFGDERWTTLRWGQRVAVRGRLATAEPGSDVVATLSARGPPRVIGRAPGVARAAERLRAGLRQASAGLGRDARGLLPGLVVGDTSQQPADLAAAFQATGLTHLCAVSGTNVTIVCVLALGVARWLGFGRRSRLVVAGLVLAGFVVLARPEPSVLRAAVMGAIGLVALATSRRRAGVPAVCTAVLVLLVVDPWLARSYGFALSVLATLGLLLWARPWAAGLSRWLPRPVAAAVAVPMAAQAACGPVVVLLSGQVSLVSVPANLLAEPLVAPATVLGLAAALASPVSASLASWLAWLGGVPCWAIAAIARRLADLPAGQLDWPGGAVGAVSLAAVTVAVLALGPLLVRRTARHPWLAGGTALLLVAACVPLPGGAWPPRGWVAVACDVGQGDALVLATGAGRGVLVDAGPDPQLVDSCLRRVGVTALDAVVLTHFHADHVEGLPGALRGRRVGTIVVTIVDDPPAEARRVRSWAARAHVPVRTARVGEQVQDGPVRWRVLWPGRVVHDGSVPNNASIVLLVEASGVRLLLLGDVEPAAAALVDRALLVVPGGPQVDVMKVAHHGSALQDASLVRHASPRLAVISVGAHNDYGHPAPSALRLLRSAGAVVARTDRQGDVAVLSSAGRLAVATRR